MYEVFSNADALFLISLVPAALGALLVIERAQATVQAASADGAPPDDVRPDQIAA